VLKEVKCSEASNKQIPNDMNTRFIDDFFEKPNALTMDALISRFRGDEVSDEDIAYLATGLGRRGEVLEHTPQAVLADVPSTGGPSSLSTLLSPLELVAGGAMVPKLGVPGRPAGGIDVLACIPGFKVSLNALEVRRCLDNCGYAHFLAGERFAPLDAKLFSHRQKVGAQNVPSLAIASLLSKKIAVGVNRVCLDVRVASFTNFGEWDQARENARSFVRVAARLGIRATAFLTDASVPYQGFIGRGEALVALNGIFSGKATNDLSDHAELCRQMAQSCVDSRLGTSPSVLRAKFQNHLEQQGSTWGDFQRKLVELSSQPRSVIRAASDGFLSVDLNAMRRILSEKQQLNKASEETFSDPCGITLLIPCGQPVKAGDAVAEVRATDALESIVDELRIVFLQLEEPIKRRSAEQIQ
jgi:pyrimidine-nucleoside phosphorylase